jgi:hypothetical protein
MTPAARQFGAYVTVARAQELTILGVVRGLRSSAGANPGGGLLRPDRGPSVVSIVVN